MEVQEPATLPEDQDLKKLYQEYLQKCCEVGQIQHQLHMLEGQKVEIEKNLEVTERSVRKIAKEHRDLQQAKFSKLKPEMPKAPELEMKEMNQ